MSEKSFGVKGKPPERQDELKDGLVNVPKEVKEKAGTNVNENATSSKIESPKILEKTKVVEKRPEQRPPMKINGVKNGNSSKPRREEDRSTRSAPPLRTSSRGKTEPKVHSSSVGSTSQSKPDTRRTGTENPSKSFSDETRLSKYMRRLMRDSDRERRLSTCRQLKDFLRTSEGAKSSLKAVDDILAVLQDVFYERNSREFKQEVSHCVGLLGGILGPDAQRYFQWLFGQTNNMIDDDIKSLFIDALYETLKYDEKKQTMVDLMPNCSSHYFKIPHVMVELGMCYLFIYRNMVMANVQTLLENADTPELLMSDINVILHIAKVFPHVFNAHFRFLSCLYKDKPPSVVFFVNVHDTVDILVGWHIDSTQKESLIDFTSKALIDLNKFWLLDLPFSLMLLGQFLEDMEAYAEDLTMNFSGQVYTDEEIAMPEECVTKIAALLKVFSTVVKSMGDGFSPNAGEQVTREYMTEVLDRIVKSLDIAVKNYFSEYMLIAGNSCLQLLMGQLKTEVLHSKDILLPFIVTQAFTNNAVSYKYTMSFISLLHKAIELFCTQLPVSFVADLMTPGSLLQLHRFSHSEECTTVNSNIAQMNVVQNIMTVYNDIMALKSVQLLEETYRYVVGDLQKAYNTLVLAAGDSSAIKSTISENPFEDVNYSVKEAETVCVFNLCALTEIGNTKSNLIAMWALSPSLFDLLTIHFESQEKAIAERFPVVQYAILSALYSHCSRHGNFASSSKLLTQHSVQEGSVLANVNPTTSGNFARILQLLSLLLSEHSTSYDSRCLCLKWVSDIIGSLQTSPHIFNASHHHDYYISMATCQCLQMIYKINNNLPTNITQSCLKLGVYRLSDNRTEIQDAYFNLLKLLPVDVTTRLYSLLHMNDDSNQTVSIHEGAEGVSAAWLAKRSHISHIPTTAFNALNFRQVMAYILHNKPPVQSGGWYWIEAMYFRCQQPETKAKHPELFCLTDFIEGNEAMSWFWATWESAQFCILNRLRTPLGKPQETFTSIESVLKQYCAELYSQQDGEDNDKTKIEQGKGGKNNEVGNHFRIHLLLHFMEHLEKLLYNAYEGCATAMPMSPKAVRTFFRTNKGTCLEWLSRIRSYIIKLALHCGLPAMAVRQAHEVLREMKENNNTQSPEFEQTVLYLVRALCDLKQADAALGVYGWCKDITGKKIHWIKAAVEKASGSKTDSDDGSSKFSSDIPMPKRITGILSKQNQNQLQETNLPVIKLGFVINEVVECYQCLSDWDSVLDWQETVIQYRQDSSLSNIQSAFNTNVDINYINLELVPGLSLSELDKSDIIIPNAWSQTQKLQHAQKQFIRVSTLLQDQKQNNYKNDFVKCLGHVERLTESMLRVDSLEWPLMVSQKTLAELTSAVVLKRQLEDKKNKTVLLPLSENVSLDPEEHDVSIFLQLQRLVTLQQQLPTSDKKSNLSSQLLQLQLCTSSLARKQTNYTLSEHLLLKQITTLMKVHSENGRVKTAESLLPALTSLRSVNGAISQLDILKVEREGSKLLHSIGKNKDSIDVLSSSIVGYVCSDVQAEIKDKKLRANCSQLCSRSLLTLVNWLQLDHKCLSNLSAQLKVSGQGDNSANSVVVNNIQLLLEMEEKGAKNKLGLQLEDEDHEQNIGDNPSLSESDSIIGRILHLSTMESPNLSKAWFTLAGWCYKWGRKAVDNASHGSVELLTDEKAEILSLLPKGTSSEETMKVLNVLSQIHTLGTSEEDISDQDQIATEECIDKLLKVWRGVVHRVYHYYQLSVKAYFTYLQLNGINETEKNDEDNVIATLRLLRLLVKHAWELRNVLETGLASTPTAPWKGIIPQLFSRLSHPELYVRQSISDLLCRVAQDAPHLIVYPAVVGCSSSKIGTKEQSREGLLNNYITEQLEASDQDDQGSQDDEEEDDPSSTMLQNCLTSIVETLSFHNPKMISEVKQLVQELRRITLLWDELWLGTLNQQHQDVTRKLSQLESEVKKVMNNSSLTKEEKLAIIKEKHRTIMKPTLYTMEKLQEITSQPAETPQEQAFNEMYGKMINTAIEKLRNPNNPNNPHSSWQTFKQLHGSLQQKAQKRSSLLLRMEKISPKLASMKNTVIAMPGLGTSGKLVTVESVSNTVQILPTKTKPKKLILLGSDGKRYPYLFKGLEDLHLDERIMQFLSIVNNMFASATSGDQQLYRARHYSVTPLGPRSGLIQWVDGATPLFGLYKRWQQRDALAQVMKSQSTSGSNSTSSSNQPTIQRPSEIFYNKLTPALREKGITNLENRKEWPLTVLRSVLQELIEDTPGDLLARELWCSSTGPSEWWHITQTYARSTAVMSMIGYIIGLGDRHLDNVLVDLATGEGTFRIASEHVIKTMRKGRETLLTLLEAFVYDPLVDWTTGNEGGYAGAFYGGGLSVLGANLENKQSKQDMEKEITISMFSIRMAEMKASWLKNRGEMATALPKLQEQVQSWINVADLFNSRVTNLQNMKELKTLVNEALSEDETTLFTLKDSVHEMVQEKINEFSHWQKIHKHVIQSIQGQSFQKMCSEVANPLNLGHPSFASASDFLQSAGQSTIVAQCEQLEEEMISLMQLQRSNLHHAIDVLHTYATIISQFGTSFADQNRTSHYLCWLQELVCDFTTDRCTDIIAQFHELYGNPGISQSKTQLVRNTETKLTSIIADVNGRLIKRKPKIHLLERRSQEANETAILELQIKECEKTVQLFVQENGLCGVSSLMAWIISELCSLNKRYNQMEAAAAGAGDRLMDLTSRDGDWFLDELCSMSSNVKHFIDMLRTNTAVQDFQHFQTLLQALLSTHNVYIALQDLNINFRTIILPEALKAIQAQETSVCNALEDLEKLFVDCQPPTGSDCVTNDNLEMITVVKRMQIQYAELLEGQDPEATELTPGQMLLMGFNGLFTRLEDEFTDLMESMDSLEVPDVWRKVDAVREGRSMQEFFHMCTQFAANLQGLEGGNCYDDEQLSRPIKRFIAEYVRKQVIGFPSQILGYMLCVLVNALGVNVTAEIELKDIGAESKVPLDDLRKKAVDVCLRNGQFQHMHFTQANALTSVLYTAWRRHDLARRLDSNIEVMKASLQRAQLQLTRLLWLHEDVYTQTPGHLNQMVMPNRATVMSEMRKSMQALVNQESGLVSCHAHYVQLESSIVQRLKWAAGANPSLNLVLQQFEESSSYRKQLFEDESKRSTDVVSFCQGILHLEALRTRTPEAVASDTNFLTLLKKCRESCMISSSASTTVSELEILLMNTKPPAEDGKTDKKWLQECREYIISQIDKLRQQVEGHKKEMESTKGDIKSEVSSIRGILTTHHKLMSEIRTILKSMAKQEELESEQQQPGSIREYLATYKNFSENFMTALKIVSTDDVTKDGIVEADSMIDTLIGQITIIYDDLVNLAPPLLADEEGKENNQRTFASALMKQTDVKEGVSPARKQSLINKDVMETSPFSPQGGLLAKITAPASKKLDKISRDPRTGKAIQERNSYAVSVWRRVKMKLDGRDPDPGKRLSVAEQVDFVMKEATNMDNLAVLYEGWTPWIVNIFAISVKIKKHNI
ncbi:hypothetical protein KUTeg_004588 [Tegillarca granosa]|uniref:non-specific serine/threonine protein kinase n=1 Tax=Tegillarca granosa TaxID=220873 RepID=A0ABQ9FU28_TEGGR|nr:hypothetical protein KUTeg_004588 [Tegillarca granosa]